MNVYASIRGTMMKKSVEMLRDHQAGLPQLTLHPSTLSPLVN
jgi:hypothetical protein